jgi:hypothetical protein
MATSPVNLPSLFRRCFALEDRVARAYAASCAGGLIRGGVFRAVRVNLRLQRRGPPISAANLGAPGAAAERSVGGRWGSSCIRSRPPEDKEGGGPTCTDDTMIGTWAVNNRTKASGAFLSHYFSTSHQPANSIFLSQRISTGHQPVERGASVGAESEIAAGSP